MGQKKCTFNTTWSLSQWSNGVDGWLYWSIVFVWDQIWLPKLESEGNDKDLIGITMAASYWSHKQRQRRERNGRPCKLQAHLICFYPWWVFFLYAFSSMEVEDSHVILSSSYNCPYLYATIFHFSFKITSTCMGAYSMCYLPRFIYSPLFGFCFNSFYNVFIGSEKILSNLIYQTDICL